MKFLRSGKLAVVAGALCALLGFASAPAQALTMQEWADQGLFEAATPTTSFGLSLAPATQPLASLFDITTYSDQAGWSGLTFTLNTTTTFDPLQDPDGTTLSFGLSGLSLGGPFINHWSFFNVLPTPADSAEFDLAGDVCDPLTNCGGPVGSSITLLSFFGGAPLDIGPIPVFPETSFLTTLTLAGVAGTINQGMAFTMAFQVPEPGTLALLGIAVLGFALRRRLTPPSAA